MKTSPEKPGKLVWLTLVVTLNLLAALCVAGAEKEVSDVMAPKVNPQRGFFSKAFTVAINPATPGADIWCTLDGTVPDPGQPGTFRYQTALLISNTTTLRARAQ